jgi:hypothetical protein
MNKRELTTLANQYRPTIQSVTEGSAGKSYSAVSPTVDTDHCEARIVVKEDGGFTVTARRFRKRTLATLECEQTLRSLDAALEWVAAAFLKLLPEIVETRVLSADGALTGVARGGGYRCQMLGCTGRRLMVTWSDGKRTRPCTKDMEKLPNGVMKIVSSEG